jgi:hypothetical protein
MNSVITTCVLSATVIPTLIVAEIVTESFELITDVISHEFTPTAAMALLMLWYVHE